MYVIKFTALLMCIFAVENSIFSLGRIGFNFIKDTLKPVTDSLLGLTITGIKIGGRIVRQPLIGTEKLFKTTTLIAGIGQEMVFKIVEGVANGLDRGWEAVETFEAIPGVEYVMIFPNAAAAIVDKALDKVTLITSLTGRTITAVEALAINTATHMVSSILGVTMRTLRMNCFRLSHLHQHIGKTLVEDMDAKGVRICGISNLRPDNNVTISEEDESFQAIKINFWIKDIRVRIKAMRVTDYSDDPVLKHTPMRVNIRNTKVVGFLEFNKGTLLKLVTIRLRVVKFKNFKIHIPVKEEKRTGVMDVVEGISIVLGQIVKKSINKMLAKWEKKLSRAITGQ